MPNLTEQQVREIIRDELSTLIRSDRFTFEKLIQMLDGRNFQFGRANGTELGLSSLEKSAFHGATPVIQASAISAPSGQANDLDSEARNKINEIRTALSGKGITAT